MYYKKYKKHFSIIAFLLIFCTLTQNISYVKAEENVSASEDVSIPTSTPEISVSPEATPALEATLSPDATASPEASPIPALETITIVQNGISTDYTIEPVQIRYEDISYASSISPLKINETWLIPVKSIFAEILNCYYKYSEEKDMIVIKSPGRDTTIQLTPGNNIAVVNETSITMPLEVLSATQKSSGATDYLVPLEFVLEQLGYTYSFQDITPENDTVQNALFITSRYLFHMEQDDVTFDPEKYENALLGVSVKENTDGTQNYIQGTTVNPIAAERITILPDIRNYSVTIQFAKTYNPFGNISRQIGNGIIKKIEIRETEDASSCISIYYDKRFIYSSQILATGGKITLSAGDFSMKILLPDNVKFSKITTTDRYWNRKFLIIIPGNHVSFYAEYAPFINSSDIKKITVKETDDGNTRITVTTVGLKGYKLTEEAGAFTVKVGEPQDIYENIVLLDAGHGGKDGGASRKGIVEKHLCLAILYNYAKKHFESPNSTVKAYWTRHDDTFINLYTRPTLSAKYQADLFVSLHMNSASTRSANGTEIYYSKKNNKKSFSGITSKKFAKLMQSTLVESLNNKDRGVKQAAFIVAKNNTVPAILIELGFITGSSDSKKLKKTSYQKKAAKAIYQGITETFKKYPTRR